MQSTAYSGSGGDTKYGNEKPKVRRFADQKYGIHSRSSPVVFRRDGSEVDETVVVRERRAAKSVATAPLAQPALQPDQPGPELTVEHLLCCRVAAWGSESELVAEQGAPDLELRLPG